jgi:hypothetical protein
MKVRTCFVANSSSSNFVCIGIKINPDKLLEKLGITCNPEVENVYDIFYNLNWTIPNSDLTVIHDYGDWYVGYGQEFDEYSQIVLPVTKVILQSVYNQITNLGFNEEVKLYAGMVSR